MPLTVEMFIKGEWRQVGVPLREGDPPGSISSVEKDGRQVYVFRCDGATSEISKSTGGADWTFGGPDANALRAIASNGLEGIAVLSEEYPEHQIPIRTEKMVNEGLLPLTVRFRHDP